MGLLFNKVRLRIMVNLSSVLIPGLKLGVFLTEPYPSPLSLLPLLSFLIIVWPSNGSGALMPHPLRNYTAVIKHIFIPLRGSPACLVILIHRPTARPTEAMIGIDRRDARVIGDLQITALSRCHGDGIEISLGRWGLSDDFHWQSVECKQSGIS